MTLTKPEEFAKKLVRLAADEGFTVYEFHKVADMAKAIAEQSIVDKQSIEKCDYLSQHITVNCGGKEVYSTMVDSFREALEQSGTK